MAEERWRKLCFRCMSELREPDGVCPDCGWDNAHRENGPGDLRACVLKGQYFVGRTLGRGGFGVTYLGYDLNLNCRVAIKEYFPAALAMRTADGSTLVPYTDARELFDWGRRRALDEGRTTAQLSRGGVPNAVQVYNAFEENGTAYIIMEYIEGITLTRLVKDNGRMSWAQAYGLVKPIMRALEAIHARGVIHRDVSPDNIMLRANSADTVLLDFGAARSYANEKKGMTETLRPGFAPPEQYSSASEQDGRTDEYALCATLYYLLTGMVPPASDQIAFGGTELTAPRKLGVDMPEAAEAALRKGISPKMEDRYPSIAALRSAFDAAGESAEYIRTIVQTGYSQPESEASRPVVEPQGERKAGAGKGPVKRRGLLALGIALALVLLAAVAIAAYLLGRGGAPAPGPTMEPTEAVTEAPTPEPTAAPTLEPSPTPTPTPSPSGTPEVAPEAPIASGSELMIGFSQSGHESARRTAITEEVVSAMDEREGWELYFSDSDQSQEIQIQALRNFIAMGSDYILISCVSPSGMGDALADVNAAGIPLIFLDGVPDCADRIGYAAAIVNDYELEGRRQVQWAGEYLKRIGRDGEHANVVILEGIIGSDAQIGRSLGSWDAIEDYPFMEVVAEQGAAAINGDTALSDDTALMDNLLLALDGEIDVVIAQDDELAMGAIKAIEAAGLVPGEDIIVVGCGATRNALEAIAAGRMNATVECSARFGQPLIDAIEAIEAGDISSDSKASFYPEEGVYDAIGGIQVEGTVSVKAERS